MARSYRPIQVRDAQGALIQLDEKDLNMTTSRAGTPNIRFVGYSRPGILTTEPAWKIKKYTYDDSNTVVRVRTATTNDLADNNKIWDDVAAVTISSVTKATPGVVTTAAAHGYTTGDSIEITGCDMTELNGDGFGDVIFTIVKTGADTFTLKDVDGDALDTSGYVSAGTTGSAWKRDYLNLVYA